MKCPRCVQCFSLCPNDIKLQCASPKYADMHEWLGNNGTVVLKYIYHQKLNQPVTNIFQ